MKRLLLLLLITTTTLASAVPASAATPVGWGQWLMPTGTVCVQTGTQTWLPLSAATAAWNKSDAQLVAKMSCSGYSRSMTVITRSYSSSTDGACAKMGSVSWAWKYVRGVWTWTPTAPTIWVNQWSRMRAVCQATYRRRLNLMSHELGHVLGLHHLEGATVMQPRNNDVYVVPTVYDIARVNRRY